MKEDEEGGGCELETSIFSKWSTTSTINLLEKLFYVSQFYIIFVTFAINMQYFDRCFAILFNIRNLSLLQSVIYRYRFNFMFIL